VSCGAKAARRKAARRKSSSAAPWHKQNAEGSPVGDPMAFCAAWPGPQTRLGLRSEFRKIDNFCREVLWRDQASRILAPPPVRGLAHTTIGRLATKS